MNVQKSVKESESQHQASADSSLSSSISITLVEMDSVPEVIQNKTEGVPEEAKVEKVNEQGESSETSGKRADSKQSEAKSSVSSESTIISREQIDDPSNSKEAARKSPELATKESTNATLEQGRGSTIKSNSFQGNEFASKPSEELSQVREKIVASESTSKLGYLKLQQVSSDATTLGEAVSRLQLENEKLVQAIESQGAHVKETLDSYKKLHNDSLKRASLFIDEKENFERQIRKLRRQNIVLSDRLKDVSQRLDAMKNDVKETLKETAEKASDSNDKLYPSLPSQMLHDHQQSSYSARRGRESDDSSEELLATQPGGPHAASDSFPTSGAHYSSRRAARAAAKAAKYASKQAYKEKKAAAYAASKAAVATSGQSSAGEAGGFDSHPHHGRSHHRRHQKNSHHSEGLGEFRAIKTEVVNDLLATANKAVLTGYKLASTHVNWALDKVNQFEASQAEHLAPKK